MTFMVTAIRFSHGIGRTVCLTAALLACQPGAASCCQVLGGPHVEYTAHCKKQWQKTTPMFKPCCTSCNFVSCPFCRPLPECPGALVPRRAAALLAGAAAPARGRGQGQVRGGVLREQHRPGRLLQGALSVCHKDSMQLSTRRSATGSCLHFPRLGRNDRAGALTQICSLEQV